MGIDTLVGGAGSDVFMVGSGDQVVENSGEGTDEIRTTIATYSPATIGNVEGCGHDGHTFDLFRLRATSNYVACPGD